MPPTLLTNDPDEVRAFAKEHGPLVYKPLTGGLLDNGRVIYTGPVDLATVDDGVRSTAHLFQQEVPKRLAVNAGVAQGFFLAELGGFMPVRSGETTATTWRQTRPM